MSPGMPQKAKTKTKKTHNPFSPDTYSLVQDTVVDMSHFLVVSFIPAAHPFHGYLSHKA